MKEILDAYGGKVRLVLRYAPFHQGADTIARSLEASRRQGKFWETLELVYARQDEWADHHHARPEVMWQYFPSVGLDLDELRQDMSRPEVDAVIRQDMADAIALGVRRTPSFLVNGRPLQRFGLRELQALVDAAVVESYGR